MSEKKLLTGEIRYVLRKVGKTWRVYDKARGSFPYHSKETGPVIQDVAEDLAQAEADRLNGLEDIARVDASSEEKLSTKETVQVNTSETEETETPEAYEDLTPEQIKKYEDGLMEKVVY